jgi:hypothetical protein
MDSLLIDKDDKELSDTSIYSLFNKNGIQRFDGSINIWLNKKDIAIFKNNSNDWDAIDILKCSPGYCIVTRSKIYKYVPLYFCCSLSGVKIDSSNIYLYSKGDVILCKMANWKKYVPCTIRAIHDKVEYGEEQKYHGSFNFGDATLTLFFSSSPESDAVLAWHYGNKIIPKCSVVSYKDILNHMTETSDGLNNVPFVNNNYENNIIDPENTIYIENDINSSSEEEMDEQKKVYALVEKDTDDVEIKKIVSGLIDKVDTSVEKYENLKYKVCWIKNQIRCFNSKNIFNSKAITVASTEFSNDLRRDFLPNVKILENRHMMNIFKLQHKYGGFLKIFPKYVSPKSEKFCNIEPQTFEQFKRDGNFRNIAYFLNNDNYITYTGPLCHDAKKYLFNL